MAAPDSVATAAAIIISLRIFFLLGIAERRLRAEIIESDFARMSLGTHLKIDAAISTRALRSLHRRKSLLSVFERRKHLKPVL